MLCADWAHGELRLFTAISWRHSGQRYTGGVRRRWSGGCANYCNSL